MARISLDPPRSLAVRLVKAYTKRQYGKEMEPALAVGHNPKVLVPYLRFEQKVAKWKTLDPGLKTLAEMVVAARIGCEWCMDFGYWVSQERGVSADKASKVPAWREHPEAFSELELLVLDYAESMTATPPTVTDELSARLQKELGEPAFVELTMMAALENLRSRVNSAFGLTGQGFSDQCEIRPAS